MKNWFVDKIIPSLIIAMAIGSMATFVDYQMLKADVSNDRETLREIKIDVKQVVKDVQFIKGVHENRR